MPVQEQGKKSKTHRNRELNKKKPNIATLRKQQYKLSPGTEHLNPTKHL
jgi:hypothetical protein